MKEILDRNQSIRYLDLGWRGAIGGLSSAFEKNRTLTSFQVMERDDSIEKTEFDSPRLKLNGENEVRWAYLSTPIRYMSANVDSHISNSVLSLLPTIHQYRGEVTLARPIFIHHGMSTRWFQAEINRKRVSLITFPAAAASTSSSHSSLAMSRKRARD